MTRHKQPSFTTRICGLSFALLGAMCIYSSTFTSGMDAFGLIVVGTFFGGPGLLGLIRGY